MISFHDKYPINWYYYYQILQNLETSLCEENQRNILDRTIMRGYLSISYNDFSVVFGLMLTP